MWKTLKRSEMFKVFWVFLCGYFVFWAPGIALGSSFIEQGEQDFNTGRYDSARIKFLTLLENSLLDPTSRGQALCKLGIIDSIYGKQDSAQEYLEKAFSTQSLRPQNGSLCYYALLQIYVMGGHNQKAKHLLESFGPPSFNNTYLTRVYALGAEVGNKLGDATFEAIYLQKLLSQFEKSGLKEVELKILNQRIITLSEVKRRLGLDIPMKGSVPENRSTPGHPQNGSNTSNHATNTQKSTPAAATRLERPLPQSPDSLVNQKNFWTEVKQNQYQDLGAYFAPSEDPSSSGKAAFLDQIFAQPELALTKEQLTSRVRALLQDKPRVLRVGILLPRQGQFAKFKHKILKSIAAFANSSAQAEMQYRYFLKSFDPDMGGVENAVYELIMEDKIHAVVGLVPTALIAGVQRTSAFFGIPYVALGPVPALGSRYGKGTVRLGTLANSQVNILLQNLKQFGGATVGMIGPNDSMGREFKDALDLVSPLHQIKLSNVALYEPKTEIFNPVVEEFMEATEVTELSPARMDEVKQAKQKAALEKRKFDIKELDWNRNLKVDAILIPDSLKKAQTIAMTLAFLKVEGIRYLGERSWKWGLNSSFSIADRHMEGARVTEPVKGQFFDFLQTELNLKDSDWDLERQAFDAMLLLRQAHFIAKTNNPSSLIDSIYKEGFSASAVGNYVGMWPNGEPKAQFALKSYSKSKFSNDLSSFPKSELPKSKKP